jgi:hypothetical protein
MCVCKLTAQDQLMEFVRELALDERDVRERSKVKGEKFCRQHQGILPVKLGFRCHGRRIPCH